MSQMGNVRGSTLGINWSVNFHSKEIHCTFQLALLTLIIGSYILQKANLNFSLYGEERCYKL